MTTKIYKDIVLANLAENTNIAQFVSYSAISGHQRFSAIRGFEINHNFTLTEAIYALLKNSGGTVNIRTFLPENLHGNEFIYGLSDVNELIGHIVRLTTVLGLYVIVSETLDVDDGGVSGVMENGMVEFFPGATVREIEHLKDPVSAFEAEFALKMLATVYGFTPTIDTYGVDDRIEFSIHPTKVGYHQTNTVIWQWDYSPVSGKVDIPQNVLWPTGFSKMIGDKAYGLLVAHTLGFPVPKTVVFTRNPKIGFFTFGEYTGGDTIWMRTCPKVGTPGQFTTTRGWTDPFNLMDMDDPSHTHLASCLSQFEIPAKYSGSLISTAEGAFIEGVSGFGDLFMLGDKAPEEMPAHVFQDVKDLYLAICDKIGEVGMEWVHDGKRVWIVQLHSGSVTSRGRVIVPGEYKKEFVFDCNMGLPYLRELISIIGDDAGIAVVGNVGMTSHICDVLRKANVPSVMAG